MRSRGFSLLEALVTLVILSMIATVLVQSLSQVLGLRERVLRNERYARIAGLEERWFRESVGAAIADLPQGEGAFRGDARSMRFLGLDPLDGRGIAVVEWRLDATDGRLRLAHRQGASAWTMRALPTAGSGFRYLDAAGGWHPRWPPQADLGAGEGRPAAWEVLPQAVAVEVEDAAGGRLWVADIGASAGLPLPLRVRLEGLDGSTSP